MTKFVKWSLPIFISMLSAQVVQAGLPNLSIPVSSHPVTFVGPTLAGSYTSAFYNSAAWSVLAELGVKNLRLSGTVAFQPFETQRFKVTAEWLAQDITYHFFDGNPDEWMNQGALGADYEIVLPISFITTVDLNAYVSHAPSKNLHTDVGQFIVGGQLEQFVVLRRIAGSTAGGAAATMNVQPWRGSDIGLRVNYDDVHYNRKNTTGDNPTGFGGGIFLHQMIVENILLNLGAEIRKPFNYYVADIGWNNIYFNGRWGLDVFGSYVEGKAQLPDTWNVGVGVKYFAECPAPVRRIDLKNEAGFCLDEDHPYAVVMSPCTPPQYLSSMPPELGPILPIGEAGTSKHHVRKKS